MKCAFYTPNIGIKDVDLTKIENGNPGIGGSEYSAILISTLLCKTKMFTVSLFCDVEGRFPKELNYAPVGNLFGALTKAKEDGYDYVIIDGKLITEGVLSYFNTVKFIAWANTFLTKEQVVIYSKYNNLVKIINVGKQQSIVLEKTSVASKSLYIYNAVPQDLRKKYEKELTIPYNRPNNVVYIGSLHPAKGFHLLAKAWPIVLNEVPDAQLYVIGAGNLYSRKMRIGKWNIAEESYENEFMRYLVKDGKIDPSVHFLGILGDEKYDIMTKCKVGVPNPSGVSETFGYTAVEMQLMGCAVTTIECPGYLDTVKEKNNLYSDPKHLSSYIIRLLKSCDYDEINTLDYIQRFAPDTIVQEWINTLFTLPTIHIKADRNILKAYIYRIKVFCYKFKQILKK